MAEKNLYQVHYDLTLQNQRTKRKMGWDEKKTVLANGDAAKAIEKLRRRILAEPPSIDDENPRKLKDRIKNIDVKVRSVELIASVDYL